MNEENKPVVLSTPLSNRTAEELPKLHDAEQFMPTPIIPEEEKEPDSSFGELVTAAKDSTWIFRDGESFAKIGRDYDGPAVTEDDWNSLTDEWDKDQLEAFHSLVDEGGTKEEWESLKEEFTVTNEANKIVQEHGVTGIGASIMTSLFDPTFLAAAGGSIAVGDKVSGLVLAGNRAGRIARYTAAMARAGFTADARRTKLSKVVGESVLADGATMALRNQTTNDYSDTDMAIDMLSTFAVIGGIETASALKAGHLAHTMEVARADSLVNGFLEEGKKAKNHLSAAEATSDAGTYRIDDYGVMMNSGNSELAWFAQEALQDGIKGGSQSAAVQASRLREHYMMRQNKAFYELWENTKKERGLQGPVKNAKSMSDLSEKLWRAVVLDEDHGAEVAKAASEFRKINSEILEKGKEAEIHGFKDVESFDQYMMQEWDTNGWRKVRTGPNALDDDELVDLIHEGLKGMDEVSLSDQLEEATLALSNHRSAAKATEGKDTVLEGLTKEVTEIEQLIAYRRRLALGFTNRMIGRSDGETANLSELMEDHDSLVKWLRDDAEFAKMSDAELRSFVKKALTTRSTKKQNVVNRAKRRISIDPSASIVKGGRKHTVADLMNKDAMGLQQVYNHQMTGNIAFANKLGMKAPSDWNAFKRKAVAAEIRNRSINTKVGTKAASKTAAKAVKELEKRLGVTQAEVNAGKATAEQTKLFTDELKTLAEASDAKVAHVDIDDAKITDEIEKQLDGLRNEIFGQSRYDLSSNTNRFMGAVMKYNFMTTMGKAAFSALSEFGRIMGENRVHNVLKLIPSLHHIVTDSFRNVNKHPSVVKEVNAFNASIGDGHLVRYYNSFDETGVREGKLSDGLLSKAETYAHSGARFMAKASLLAPMDKMLRLVSFQSSVNSLHAHLMKGSGSRMAFREIGMTPDLLKRIQANMEKHKVETDIFGNVKRLNIESWDRKTADEMMDALTVNGNRQVQKTIAGENTAITSHPVGRVFLQFRKFAIDAYTKHLRADIHAARNGDMLRVLLSNTYAAIMAGIGYSTRTYLSTTGMDDRERDKVLNEKLSDERVAANIAAYSPSGGSIVSLWNMTAGTAFPDSVIPVSRASGLNNSSFASNPSFAAGERVQAFFHDIGGSEPEDLLSRGRFAFPFQNTLWGDIVINSAASSIK